MGLLYEEIILPKQFEDESNFRDKLNSACPELRSHATFKSKSSEKLEIFDSTNLRGVTMC